MIFLDEPLSGLDSYAAFTVVQVLKDLASIGCAVLCTIHQPSSEIFSMFDKVICLADGNTCYGNSVSALTQYMEQIGKPVPIHHSPADHMLFFVQTQSEEDLAKFTQCWAEVEKTNVLPQIARLREGAAALPPTAVHRKNCALQLYFLLKCEWQQLVRDKIGLILRFVVNGIMGVLFAFIFENVGSASQDGLQGGRQGHFGAICNLMIGTMFGTVQPLLLQFPLERPIFLREYAANMYGTIPYFLAKTMVEIPLTFLTALGTWLIAYWIMDMSGNFLYLVLITWGMGLTAASIALLVGCCVPNAQMVQELAPLVFVTQILFTGIFIPISLVPAWLRWMQYVCALKYAINLGCIVEFAGSPDDLEWLKQTQEIDPDNAGLYVVILACIFLGVRTLAVLALRQRAQFVF